MSAAKDDSISIGSSRVTWEGCSVLLDINDGERLVFARLSPNAKLKIGKSNCSLNPLIGCPFGSLFRVDNGKDGPFLSLVLQTEEQDEEEGNSIKEKEDHVTGPESKDNRAIVDNNTAQSLTGEDIEELRRQGATGDQIIEALIANSATFEKKTSFSQEKYRLRKQKKYAPKVLVRRPFVRSICDAYFRKNPAKIGYLRCDSLSLLLSMANITAYSDILVVDMIGGIITGAVAERLGRIRFQICPDSSILPLSLTVHYIAELWGSARSFWLIVIILSIGTGHVCNLHMGAAPYPMDIVRIFNFSNDICERIVHCALDDLCPGQNGSCEQVQEKVNDSNKEPDHMEEDVVAEENTTSSDVPCTTASDRKVCKSIKAGEKASDELINSWKESGFSSLIVAAPDMDVWSIMQKLHPFLSSSASFAIYHQYLQPLADCMHNLQTAKMAIGLQITEPWLREYQVLPSRTHPRMQMSAFGGYILSGTKITATDLGAQ